MTSVSLEEAADRVGATCIGESGLLATGISSLSKASVHEISFLSSKKFRCFLAETKALAVILKPADSELYKGNKLIVDDPYLAYAKLANFFHAGAVPVASIGKNAVIATSASVGDKVSIGANSVLEANVTIGDEVYIGANCYIGANSKIGKRSKILPNVTILDNIEIGKDCILHAGSVIGDDGFGYAKDNSKWLKIPQTGRVVIGDNVEIGSNTTIDRGALEDTIIDNGVKLDNQVHVAHNVHIGENTAIAGGTGISGSVEIGKNCTIAGMVGISGHLTICDNVQITGTSMITKSVLVPGTYSSGWPARKANVWRKMVAGLSRLASLTQRIKNLEAKLDIVR